jgi:hypothetical protein
MKDSGVTYSLLTSDQIAQAGYLFADPLFGTDPADYWYEIDAAGFVTGRVKMEKATRNKYSKRSSEVYLTTMIDPYATPEQIRRRAGLASMLAEKIMETKYEKTDIPLSVA